MTASLLVLPFLVVLQEPVAPPQEPVPPDEPEFVSQVPS